MNGFFDTTDDERFAVGCTGIKQTNIQLGDFRRLIGFLIENSGRKSMVENYKCKMTLYLGKIIRVDSI